MEWCALFSCQRYLADVNERDLAAGQCDVQRPALAASTAEPAVNFTFYRHSQPYVLSVVILLTLLVSVWLLRR